MTMQSLQPQKRSAAKRERNPIHHFELCDNSLAPLAQKGDIAIINPFREPESGNLIALKSDGQYLIKYFYPHHKSASLRDKRGRFKTLPLAEIEILGVVHSILRPVK